MLWSVEHIVSRSMMYVYPFPPKMPGVSILLEVYRWTLSPACVSNGISDGIIR